MGCMNIVIYLLQHDANPDVPTVRGETPLHLAARANQVRRVRSKEVLFYSGLACIFCLITSRNWNQIQGHLL